MKIELESIEKLHHYEIVIRNGVAFSLRTERLTNLENYANVEIENAEEEEQKKKRSATRQELANAIEYAQIIGREGEEFVNDYLNQKYVGLNDQVNWESNTNAIAPHDFVVEYDGSRIYIDVKSTKGPFSNLIHISYNELLEMGEEEKQYQIYRVFAVSDTEAQLRVIECLGGLAKEIIRVFKALPEYVKPDGITLSPSNLKFGDKITIHRIKAKNNLSQQTNLACTEIVTNN